jgi:hypothetical protein
MRWTHVNQQRVARLLGLSHDEFAGFVSVNMDESELVAQRLERAGLRAGQVRQSEPDLLRLLCINCSACKDRARCLIELTAYPGDNAGDDWREYCGNAGLINVLDALMACSGVASGGDQRNPEA